MSEEQEKEFERLCPTHSILGREFAAIRKERDSQKQRFENADDKMAYDTHPYRRSEIAVGRFLDDIIPLILKSKTKLEDAKEALERAEAKAQYTDHGHGISIDRRSERIIWVRFAIERYRLALPHGRKPFKAYHPELYREIAATWKLFWVEIRRWMKGLHPYDRSQAMHYMIAFQMKARLLASSND